MRTPSPAARRPPVAPRELPAETGSIIRWRTVAWSMLLGGAVLIEAALAGSLVDTSQPVLVHVVSMLFVALAAVLWWVRLDTYLTFARVLILASVAGITLLSVAVEGMSFIPVFYLWPLLGAAYLLPRVEVVLISVGTAVCCGVAFAARAEDFPVADFAAILLVGSIVVVSVRVLSEGLSGTMKSLRHSSLTDPLTGLLNRRGFEASLAHQFERAKFDGRPITTLLLDLDHFKTINDTHGHGVGDQALRRFAELLESSCRASDIVARVGGEEFAFVMPGATIEQAAARAELFTAVVREDRAIADVRMTVSVGVASKEPGSGDWHAMLDAADAAVYAAKREGRDRTVVAPVAAGPAPVAVAAGL